MKLSGMLRHNKLYVPVSMCRGHFSKRWGKSRKEVVAGCCCRGHWIADAIGAELAGKLCITFGREILDIAPCYRIVAHQRNSKMRQRHKEGAGIADLMVEFKMSKRAVFYIIAGWNGRQTAARGTSPARREGMPKARRAATHPPGLGPS